MTTEAVNNFVTFVSDNKTTKSFLQINGSSGLIYNRARFDLDNIEAVDDIECIKILDKTTGLFIYITYDQIQSFVFEEKGRNIIDSPLIYPS